MINESLKTEYTDEELHDTEVIFKVFENADPIELKRVKEIHDLSDEQITAYVHFSKLRKNTIENMRLEISERENTNPQATEVEMDLGTHLEYIEPQVRDLVVNLHKKGYTTTQSGFYGANNLQVISFEDPKVALDMKFPKELLTELDRRGVEFVQEDDYIGFKTLSPLSLEELHSIWSEIEQHIPDLGKKAPPSNHEYAKTFRENQEKL